MAFRMRSAHLRLAALPRHARIGVGAVRHMSLLPPQALALLRAEVPVLHTPLTLTRRRQVIRTPTMVSHEPAELVQHFNRFFKSSNHAGRSALLHVVPDEGEAPIEPQLLVSSQAELRAALAWLPRQPDVKGRPPVQLAAPGRPLLQLSFRNPVDCFDLCIDIDAARAPNRMAPYEGRLGPEMRLSPVSQLLVTDSPRQIRLPGLTIRIPIDVAPLLAHPVRSFAPLGDAPAEPPSVLSASASDAALRRIAEDTARRASEALAQSSWARNFPFISQRAFKDCVQQLVTLYWKGDGERFTVNLAFPLPSHELRQEAKAANDAAHGAHGAGQVHVNSAQLDFDNFAAHRQPHIKALSRNAEEVWPPTYAEEKARSEKAERAQERRERMKISAPPEEPLSEARQSRPTLRMSAYGKANSFLERLADEQGLVYRQHAGNLGLFGYGAGMGMGTFDGVVDEGGHPANFFDGGGGASIENSKAAMEILRLDNNVRCIFVNIFGGITRSDLVAQGILQAYAQFQMRHIPLVARFRGNMAEEAKATLSAAAERGEIDATLIDDFRSAAREAVRRAGPLEQKPRAAGLLGGGSPGASQKKLQAKAARSAKRPTVSAGTTLAASRTFVTSAALRRPLAPFHFLTGYAFAGKPRGAAAHERDEDEDLDPEERAEAEAEAAEARAALMGEDVPPLPQQGFPADSEIGRWRDGLLREGDAGEDALTVSRMRGTEGETDGGGDVLIAVADGVGGWAENGIDPALFSQSLMYHATAYAQQHVACPDRLDIDSGSLSGSSSSSTPSDSTAPTTPGSSAGEASHGGAPLSILEYAYQRTLEQPEVPAGSSTATVLTLDSTKGILRSANVGDSGFLVLRTSGRSGKASAHSSSGGSSEMREGVFYASAPLQHGFNTPLQLAKLPPAMRRSGSIDSSPRDAHLWQAQLRAGDLVIVATDGFFDNVSTPETTQLVRFVKEKHHQTWVAAQEKGTVSGDAAAEERSLVQAVAHNLVQYAIMCMRSPNKQSPFEREAARHGIRFPGGKVDDVAVVTALVVER